MGQVQSTPEPPSLHERLIAIVRERSFSNDREVTLASGKKSWLYFNMKPTMLDAEGAFLIGQLMLDELAGDDIDYVGGLELGAVPIVSFISALSFERAPGKPLAAMTRPQSKIIYKTRCENYVGHMSNCAPIPRELNFSDHSSPNQPNKPRRSPCNLLTSSQMDSLSRSCYRFRLRMLIKSKT